MAGFREALAAVAPGKRDAWLDELFGLEDVPADDPALPRGCVPYLPAPIDRLIELADYVGESDVFVDIGAGVGRAAVAMHLLTGADAIGLEIQPRLAVAARALAERMNARVSVIDGDAVTTLGQIATGTVFFLYCPFSDARLRNVLDVLEDIARARRISVCCLDLPLPEAPWLTRIARPSIGLDVFHSPAVP